MKKILALLLLCAGVVNAQVQPPAGTASSVPATGVTGVLTTAQGALGTTDIATYFSANGGAYNGATDCTAALTAALAAISTNAATLQFSGPCAFASSKAIPSN